MSISEIEMSHLSMPVVQFFFIFLGKLIKIQIPIFQIAYTGHLIR
jgi:hypothetical protein